MIFANLAPNDLFYSQEFQWLSVFKSFLIDDIDGSEASETIVFALEGKEYSIDLNAKHANQLRDAFAPFVQHASPRKRRATAAAAKSGPAPAEIRAWAQEMGHGCLPGGGSQRTCARPTKRRTERPSFDLYTPRGIMTVKRDRACPA